MQLHKNNWQDVFAGFRVAFSLKKILLGAVGVYVTALAAMALLYMAGAWWPEARPHFDALLKSPTTAFVPFVRDALGALGGLIANGGLGADGTFAYRPFAFLAGSGILILLIWSLVAGAICRLAAVDFATASSHPLSEGVAFAVKRFGAFFWSPVVPVIGVVILMLLASVVGLVGRIPVIGPPLTGLAFFIAVFFSGISLIVLIATCFGMPFMWPTIATEGTNAFDAISRSFNYVLARPWKTVWCWLLETVYGAVVVGFVAAFAWVMMKMALAAVAFGMGGAEFTGIAGYLTEWRIPPGTAATSVLAGLFIKVVYILVVGLVCGFAASYKWTACTLTYFVIRRDLDGVPMDEVYLPAQPEPDDEAAEAPAPDGEPESEPGA